MDSRTTSSHRRILSSRGTASRLVVVFEVDKLFARNGDPELFVMLVPVGALLLFLGVLHVARST